MQLSYHLTIKECPEARKILEDAGYKLAPLVEKVSYMKSTFFAIDLLEKEREALPEFAPYVLSDWLITKKYAKDELRAAQWLGIRAAWQQYHIANGEKVIHRPCEACFCNRQQTGTYKVSASVKKARKAFLTPPDINDLLVRDDARELLEGSDLKGFHFREIICGNKDSALQRFSQMVIETILPPAMRYDDEDFQEKYVCKSCGTHYSIIKGSAIMKMDETVMKEATRDIYFSHEQFSASGCSRTVIISGRFYRLLADNGFANDITVDDVVKLV